MKVSDMKILVIGGTGFIGTHVVKRLINAGHEAVVFHRGETKADLPPDVRHIFGDRGRLSEFANVFKEFSPDVVLDMMPYVEQDAASVMQTFRGIAGRVVAISSQDVYRTYGILWGSEKTLPNATPIGEDAPLRSVLYPYRPMAKGRNERNYNYDKIPVERIFMSNADLPGTILRLPAVYGSGDRQHRWFEYLKRMDDGRPFILIENELAKWRWTRGYVENVADAIALAVTDERAANQIYNVGEPESITQKEWVQSIAQIVGWCGEIITVPKDALPEHLKSKVDFSYDYDLDVDTSRIRKELDYNERVTRSEALMKTIDWERANPPEINPQQFDYAAEDAVFEALKLKSLSKLKSTRLNN